jgi:hypothetical protein
MPLGARVATDLILNTSAEVEMRPLKSKNDRTMDASTDDQDTNEGDLEESKHGAFIKDAKWD